jgi:hypothetical protein
MVMGARAGFHAGEARWQRGDEFEQLGARHMGPHQGRLARCIHAANGKTFFARSMPTDTIAMHFPSQTTSELMKISSFPSWHPVAGNRKPQGAWWLARDGEVPFIR